MVGPSGSGAGLGRAAGPVVVVLCLGALAALASPVGSQDQPVARVVRDFAAVHTGPGPEHPLVWRLYEGSQVAVLGEAPGSDGATWRRVTLWNSQAGWLEAGATTFEPYPPPAQGGGGGDGGPCQPKATPLLGVVRPLAAEAEVLAPTSLLDGPDGSPAGELGGGTARAEAWTLGVDGRVRYQVAGAGGAGWAAPGAVGLRAADPPGRLVGGRPIVEPLRGVGMWFVPDSRERGAEAGARVAAAARAAGLSHLYVEVATSQGGFWGRPWLDELLPAARAAGVALIGSVYACLDDLPADLALSLEVARYRTPDGLALDGLTVDVEETLVAENVAAFGELLRHGVGDDLLLVATVYPPESWFGPRYPWPALARSWNAVAPMAYWRQMEARAFTPAEVVAYTRRNIEKTRALVGRPDMPVEMLGQLFEMGRPRLLGPDGPTAGEVLAAAAAAREAGAIGISYFDWTRATPEHWRALAGFRW